MGELINLAEYREQKLQSEISEIRAELSWIVQEWLEIASLYSAVVPFLETHTDLVVPTEVIVD